MSNPVCSTHGPYALNATGPADTGCPVCAGTSVAVTPDPEAPLAAETRIHSLPAASDTGRLTIWSCPECGEAALASGVCSASARHVHRARVDLERVEVVPASDADAAVAALNERVDRTEAELARVSRERDEARSALLKATSEVPRLMRERDEAREALERYGRHDEHCPRASRGHPFPEASCTCGFGTLLAEHGGR